MRRAPYRHASSRSGKGCCRACASSPGSRTRHDIALARESGKRTVGALFRRTRPIVGPQSEARFDGIAGCLRVATGGSSRQSIIEIRGDEIRTRLLNPRECARLMGLPDAFRLPANVNNALSCVGDGVAVPVVAFLSENLLLPLLDEVKVEVAL
jgi:DNA (cytosine-5)-methyltransferase 1